MQPTHHETLAELSGYELGELERLGRRGRKGGPSLVGTDAPRLKSFGLVEYLHETRSGTTWWRVTDAGRSVLAARSCPHKKLSIAGNEETGLRALWCEACGAPFARRRSGSSFVYEKLVLQPNVPDVN